MFGDEDECDSRTGDRQFIGAGGTDMAVSRAILLAGIALGGQVLAQGAVPPPTPATVPGGPGDAAPAPAGATDTLGQAIADAYANNPRLQAQRAQLRGLDESVIQAASPYRLNLGVIGTLNYQESLGLDVAGDPTRFKTRNFGASLTASQILLNGGRTAAQVSAAEADVLSGRERLRELENFTLLELVDSYVSVRRDQEVVVIQERSVASYTRQVDQARARERGGDLTRTDIAQAQAQLGIVRASLAQARASLEQSRARFAVVVGRNPGTLAPEPALPGLPISVDRAYQVADQESPTLWQAILNQRSARERIAAERAERRPQLTAEGRFGYSTVNTLNGNDLTRNLAGGVTLRVPILAQGIIGSRIREAIASEQRLGFVVEDTRRQVNQQLQNSWNQSIAARDQLAAAEEGVVAAEAALTGVRRGFAEGFRSNFEVLDSEQRLLNAQLIVASARYARYAGQASLLAYLGRLEAAALEQSVQRYDAQENLEKQRRRQIGPFQLLLEPLDKLQKPGRDSRPSPVVPTVQGAVVRDAAVPAPEGPLSRAIPVDATVPPPAYTGPAPSERLPK